jgi:hypothetical protein
MSSSSSADEADPACELAGRIPLCKGWWRAVVLNTASNGRLPLRAPSEAEGEYWLYGDVVDGDPYDEP